MTSVTAMSAVHEYVHQRAQEKRQPDECTQDMGALDQIIAANRADSPGRARPTRLA